MHKLVKHLKLIFIHACVMHRTRAIASFEKLGRTTKFLRYSKEVWGHASLEKF